MVLQLCPLFQLSYAQIKCDNIGPQIIFFDPVEPFSDGFKISKDDRKIIMETFKLFIVSPEVFLDRFDPFGQCKQVFLLCHTRLNSNETFINEPSELIYSFTNGFTEE